MVDIFNQKITGKGWPLRPSAYPRFSGCPA